MGYLKVQPEEIVFDDIKPQVLYVMTISVRNTSTVAQRIRLQAPKSSFFALNYIPAGPIAPGLDLRAEVEFQIPTDASALVFRDVVVASMGDERVDIPLKAVRPHPVVRFEPIANLGNVLLQQSVSREIVFENVSDLPTTVSLAAPRDASLSLSLMRFDLKPGAKGVVRMQVTPKALGPLRELVKVKVGGALEDFQIDIAAKVIEQHLILLSANRDGILDSAKFGELFFGQTRTINALLVNNGPFPVNFSVKYEDEEEVPSNNSGKEKDAAPQSELDPYTKQISCFPLDGSLKPFSELSLSLTFTPQLLLPGKGFEREHNQELGESRVVSRTLRIDCPDAPLSQPLPPLVCQGQASFPFVTLNPRSLRFGECPVYDRRDILLTLSNKAKLSVAFSFPSMANFKFSPQRGKVLGGESISVVASFVPPQLGSFQQTVEVEIGGEKGREMGKLTSLQLKVYGESRGTGEKRGPLGGTDKLPQDFAFSHKFVDQEERKEERAEKLKAQDRENGEREKTIRHLMRKTRLIDMKTGVDMNENKLAEEMEEQLQSSSLSLERDDLYRGEGGKDGVRNTTQSNNSEEEEGRRALEERREHNKKYATYLQKSSQLREMKREAESQLRLLDRGAVDLKDPFGVNLGMERGLDEPTLPLPAATEPLFLLSTASGPGGGAGGQGKLTFDENRLIQKKYSSTPKTQAEMRDCSMELAMDQLKLISSSHKVVDFGKVCVGSLSPKSFGVFNNLSQSILVSLEDLSMEMQNTAPLVQILPANSTGGFDLYFSSKALGKVSKSFRYVVNSKHYFNVSVSAEVVPITLQLSRKEIVMEFPPEHLQPTLTTEVVLSNPGNAQADFLWGSAGAFTCDPDKGSIAPFKSTVVTVTWDPHSGKRGEEELGLHVTGGVDQTLLVKGVLKEAKGEFNVKKVNLNVMAVGTEKELTNISIKNTGENPLVFFMSPMDDMWGVKVEPKEGIVMPNEQCDLNVKITPKTARSYDNLSIVARVRGGKNVVCKLLGSSIVPAVELIGGIEGAKGIDFGPVTVGDSKRMDVTIVNKSPIPATLLLDLNSYSEFSPRIIYPLEPLDVVAKERGEAFPQQEDEGGNRIALIPSAYHHSNNNSNAAGGNKKSKKKPIENTWKIILQPQASLPLELIFKPLSAKKHSFALPLHLLGLDHDKSLARDVKATGLASLLQLQHDVIDFNDRIVARDSLARSSYFMETTITNTSSIGLSFVLKEGDDVVQFYESSPTASSLKFPEDESLQDNVKIFFVSPLCADLPPGGSVKLRITFQPQANALYYKKLFLFIKNREEIDSSVPYLTLLTIGSGVYPRLTFSSPSLQLPTVPLGFTSKTILTIYNNGYNALEVRHRISPSILANLEISYPNGTSLGIMIEQITVIISVKSDTPVSFMGKIEFYDQEGERFGVNISGCIDNCLLTNYSFIRQYTEEYGFIGLENEAVQYLSVQQIGEMKAAESKRREEMRKLRSLERHRAVEAAQGKDKDSKDKDSPMKKSLSTDMVSMNSNEKGTKPVNRRTSTRKNSSLGKGGEDKIEYASGVDLDKPAADKNVIMKLLHSEAVFLLKWLNKNVCRRELDTEKYPYCIVENNADNVVDCIEQMSGKKLSGLINNNNNNNKVTRRGSADKEEKRASEKSKKIANIDKVVYKYTQILNFLTSNGGLVSHINPILLLNQEDSMFMQEYELTRDNTVRVTPALLSTRKGEWQAQWLEKCEAGWLEVLYQAVKVFILPRCNYKEYSKLPGVVLSVKESNLINPLTSHNPNEETKKKKAKVPNYPKDLEPSNVFTHGEAILLAWCTYHLQHAEGCKDEGVGENQQGNDLAKFLNFNRRVIDFTNGTHDFFTFCQLLHSHVTDIATRDNVLCGYTTIDRSTQQDSLFEAFDEALQEYHAGLSEGFRAEEVLCSSRNILLMVLHLYLQLPHLIPKAKIEFTGLLGSPILKKIELKNSSKKPLVYQLCLKGSGDFSCESYNDVVIAGESQSEVVVACQARFMHPVQCRLYCWNKKENGNAVGAMLCFELVSKITGIKPKEILTRSVSLFELETFQINVKNVFDQEGSFQIRLQVRYFEKKIESYLQLYSNETNKGNRASSPTSKEVFREISIEKPDDNMMLDDAMLSSREASDDWEIENMFWQPFWMNDDFITIPRKGSKLVTVYCLPFLLGKYQCDIVFVEKDLGEFSYALHADVALPKPADKLEVSMTQGQKARLSLALGSKNTVFEKAYGTMTEMRIKNANKKIKARGVFFNMLSSKVVHEDNGGSDFHIDFLPAFCEYKRNITLVSDYMRWTNNTSNNASKAKKNPKTFFEIVEGSESSIDHLNRSLMVFSAEKAGVYRTMAVVYSKDSNHRDIRCVECSVLSRVASNRLVIEFNGPSRKNIVQEIPVPNETDSVWNLAITINNPLFSTKSKTLQIQPKDTAILEIAYLSHTEGQYEGKLLLKNTDNLDLFEYSLVGKSEECLAEGNMHYKLAARKKQVFNINLPGIEEICGKKKDQLMLEVESDIAYMQYNKHITLDSSHNNVFDFSLFVPMGGEITGTLSFIDKETNAKIWYVIRIDITSPLEEKQIDVECEVRKAAAIEILLDNVLDEDIVFNVLVEGQQVLGDVQYFLPAKNSSQNTAAPYVLIYSPLLPGQHVGKISFFNSMVGEIWYKLNLRALPAAPIELGVIESMLGGMNKASIVIDNPLAENITVSGGVEDSENFSIFPTKLLLSPYMQATVDVIFRPSSIGNLVESSVKLYSKQLGEMSYIVKGTGLLPGVMDTVYIEGPIQEISSQSVVFKNPFSHPLPIEILLNAESDGNNADNMVHNTANSSISHSNASAFSLLLRRNTDVVIPPKASYHIPIAFSPTKLSYFSSTLLLRSVVNTRPLLWCFPIIGVPEAGPAIFLGKMQAKSKTSLMKEVVVALTGIVASDFEPKKERKFNSNTEESNALKFTDFSLSLDIEEEVKNLVTRTFRVQAIDLVKLNQLNDSSLVVVGNAGADYGLRCRLLFEPLRVFSAAISVNILHKRLGKWKAKVDVDSLDPDPDDTIRLVATVHGQDKVSFKLLNQFLGFSPFQAFFTSNSSPHFSVYPLNGTLLPYDSPEEGTTFTITFAPKEYGVVEQATLMVLTEDAQWSYAIKGSYPETTLHQVKSKVDNKRLKIPDL